MACQHLQRVKELEDQLEALQQKLLTEREDSQHWQKMCESAPDYMAIVDSERKFIWSNRVHSSLTLEQLLTKRMDDFTAKEDVELAKATIAACHETGKPEEYLAHFSVNGEKAWARTRAVPLKNAPGQTLLVNSDVTAQIQAEQAQQYSIERLTSALKVAGLGYWEWSLTSGEHYWSDEIYQFLGADPASVQPNKAAFIKRVHSEDQAKLLHALQGILEGKEVYYALEFRRLRSQGDIRYFILRGDIVCDEKGRPLKIRSSLMDITSTRQATQAAQSWESRFRAAIQAAGQMVYDWDVKTGHVDFVGALSQFWATNSVRPRTMTEWQDKIVPADRIQATLQHLAVPKGRVGCQIEYRIQHQDRVHHIQEYAEPVVEPNGQVHVVGLVTDVSFRVVRELGLSDMVARQNTLLQEVHHRAKNNLQLVASLIQLHRRESDSSKFLLGKLGGLVRAMSLVHEQLHRTTNYGRVSVNRYSQNLINYIRSSGSDQQFTLNLTLRPENIELDAEQATPFGLVLVGELLELCQRVAADGSSRIDVEVTEKEGSLRLCISGHAVKASEQCSTSLGIRLTQILTQQLTGKLERFGVPETSMILEFPAAHSGSHSNPTGSELEGQNKEGRVWLRELSRPSEP